MSRTARLWRGAGFLMLGSLLPGVSALAADDPPLSTQLTELGRQALAQGAAPAAETFFQKALLLDPNNKLAAQGLEKSKQGRGVIRVAMQDPPATPPAVPAAPAPGVADQPVRRAARYPRHHRADPGHREPRAQQLTHDVEQRLQTARELMDQGQPEAALNQLRLDRRTSSAPRSTCRRPIARPSTAASRRR